MKPCPPGRGWGHGRAPPAREGFWRGWSPIGGHSITACSTGVFRQPPGPLDFPSVCSDISVMTEITEKTGKLPGAAERFVLHWGDMGGQWGVNRSISQIHALLYLSERPRTAEDIAAVLGLARSNVSTSIRQLMAWNLIRRVPVKGDRREHFEAETDVWEIAMRIAAIRKEREIDSAVEALRACVADAERDPKLHPIVRKRLSDMLAFVETLDRWYMQMLTVPKPKLAAL